MKWWHCVLSTKPPAPLRGGREGQSWVEKRVHSGAGGHCVCELLHAAVWDFLLQTKWLKSQFIPLWNNTGHVKADWSVCRKRSWSKEDRDGKDVFMMSVLCELLFHFLSEWFFSFYFSPILLSLYHVSEPCGRLGTELMAARPDPVPQKVKRNLTAQKFRNIWIKTIQKLIQEVKIEGQRQFLVRMCPCVH